MRFLETIDNPLLRRFINGRIDVLSRLDPNRIYIENVRSLYGIPTPIAKLLCEMAVRQGLFEKRVSVECPNEGRVLTTAASEKELPQTIYCENCEALEKEKYEFALNECRIVKYYKLKR
jgi:hypothetical protein